VTDDLYAAFSPRFVRYVAWAAIAIVAVGGLAVAWVAPGTDGRGYAWVDVLGTALLLGAGCAFLWRQASVAARVDTRGITVRNLLRVKTFDWSEVVAVTFGSGDPWVMLELADGTTWPVMAVQRADGGYAAREAARLASLVVLHGEGRERLR